MRRRPTESGWPAGRFGGFQRGSLHPARCLATECTHMLCVFIFVFVQFVCSWESFVRCCTRISSPRTSSVLYTVVLPQRHVSTFASWPARHHARARAGCGAVVAAARRRRQQGSRAYVYVYVCLYVVCMCVCVCVLCRMCI